MLGIITQKKFSRLLLLTATKKKHIFPILFPRDRRADQRKDIPNHREALRIREILLRNFLIGSQKRKNIFTDRNEYTLAGYETLSQSGELNSNSPERI